MDTMTIESRHFILAALTEKGKQELDIHGKFWHVLEEKLRIPRFNRPGYVLQAPDGHVMLLRKNSEHFKIESEYFKDVEITLDYCEEDIQGNDNSQHIQESVENRQ